MISNIALIKTRQSAGVKITWQFALLINITIALLSSTLLAQSSDPPGTVINASDDIKKETLGAPRLATSFQFHVGRRDRNQIQNQLAQKDQRDHQVNFKRKVRLANLINLAKELRLVQQRDKR